MKASRCLAQIVDSSCWAGLEKEFNLNPFLSASWLTAFAAEGRTPVYIVIYRGGRIGGLIAGLEVKSRRKLLKDISKVYYFFSGPFAVDHDEAQVGECIKSVLELGAREWVQRAYFRSYAFHTDFSVGSAICFRKRQRSEFVMDLRCSVDEAWRGIKKQRRKAIRKAERAGLRFSENSDPDAINDLVKGFEFIKERKRSKGHAVAYNPIYMDFIDRRVMANLLRSNAARIYQIGCGGETLCSSLVLQNEGYAYQLFFGSREKGYELGAPAALKWELMKKCIGCEVGCLNFGGVPSDASAAGIRQFKESLGAEEKLCFGGESGRIQGRLRYCLYRSYIKGMQWRCRMRRGKEGG
ncbi:MAG TPA: GNAT family N-acetyltransferase [Planctomycetota bacterium]|nr:GNAT family N-acetyltransferase [Planctomycetota bacterium]OQC20899.1 MAG: FemAB family protein [Planctomycetes bacterium ADurb.Bin069]HNR98395.1 GNAT family N-acetyltransferase [Planctomycetota bacterium]HNU25185.1 GNAT family N-acetyltransferase [Planctomycetota bacterium]HOE30173.1 GNAT family N-acetyltransferase [Planctomycetota bacterium]